MLIHYSLASCKKTPKPKPKTWPANHGHSEEGKAVQHITGNLIVWAYNSTIEALCYATGYVSICILFSQFIWVAIFSFLFILLNVILNCYKFIADGKLIKAGILGAFRCLAFHPERGAMCGYSKQPCKKGVAFSICSMKMCTNTGAQSTRSCFLWQPLRRVLWGQP